MVIVEIGEYLNADNCSNNDIVEILSEGSYSVIKDNQTHKDKRVLNLDIALNGKNMIYTPSVKVLKDFARKWGKDTLLWVGKKFQVELRTIEAYGKEQVVVRPKFMS